MSKEPYRLPAIGKPKPKAAKSDIKSLGRKANEDFKKGTEDREKKDVKGVLETMTAKDMARVEKELRDNYGMDDRERDGYTSTNRKSSVETVYRRKRLAQITGT